MHNRIDAVAGSAPGRLLPVESIQSQRKAQDDHAGLEPPQAPAVAFSPREEQGVNAYAPPPDIVAARAFVTPDPVAPALAEALAAEPWGHPMPQKAMWEQAAAARERMPEPEPVEATVTIVASTATVPAAPASSAPAVTPVSTTAAAPATPAAAASAGAAAPVSPAWLTSLLKAR
jgi:hypothetical protein